MSTKEKVAKGPSLPVRGYLTIYNLLSACGWAYVLKLVVESILNGDDSVTAWSKFGPTLQIVQSAACLEIFHSLFKLVPSAWFTTFIQVMSRLIVLWGYTSASSYQHWSLFLMATSWSIVEVPRYLFYVWQLVFPNKQAPGPLFALRYSLFAILYPTGITGEVLQMWNAMSYWRQTAPWFRIVSYIILFGVYPPLSPYMYLHMVSMRRTQYKKRAAALQPKTATTTPQQQPEGLLFPIDKDTGDVSSLNTGKLIFAASIRHVNNAAAELILKEKNWRFGYAKHIVKHVEYASESKENAVAMAQAGLDALYTQFRFVRDGYETTLNNALTRYPGTFLEGKYVGRGIKSTTSNKSSTPAAPQGLYVPYQNKYLQGTALQQQLDSWVKYGTIEPSCAEAIKWAANNAKDLSSYCFVLLGAGAAMGPLSTLLHLNATIIAVDLDRPGIWERILNLVDESKSTIYFPMKSHPVDTSIQALSQVAGCNLFTQTPEIARFVSEILPGKQLVIGTYVYLDSAAHVQVSLAADAVVRVAIEKRGIDNVIPAYLCSPTDVFTENKETYDAAVLNRKKAPLWQRLISTLFPSLLRPNGIKSGPSTYINDGIVVAQGPNYALAKRLQHWRAIVSSAGTAHGGMVSSNIAPSTATLSVVHNSSFAAAYGGMHRFKPMEVMFQETSNAVMAALLIHDVLNKNHSPKNPQCTEGQAVAKNPMLLFAQGAFHGGVWRIGYSMNTIGPVAALSFYLGKYGSLPLLLTAGLVGMALYGPAINLP